MSKIVMPPGVKQRSPSAGAVNGESCATCWYGKRLDPVAVESAVICRRKPPVPFLVQVSQTGLQLKTFYPTPDHDEWCGDHLPRSKVVQP